MGFPLDFQYLVRYYVLMTPATRARLEAAAGAVEERNDAIRTARNEGATYREIATVVGMSEAGIRKIINKENPTP